MKKKTYLNEEMLDISFWINICSAKMNVFFLLRIFHVTQIEIHQHPELLRLHKKDASYYSFEFIYLSFEFFCKIIFQFFMRNHDFYLSVKLFFNSFSNKKMRHDGKVLI